VICSSENLQLRIIRQINARIEAKHECMNSLNRVLFWGQFCSRVIRKATDNETTFLTFDQRLRVLPGISTICSNRCAIIATVVSDLTE
jgi:hypothetical protein